MNNGFMIDAIFALVLVLGVVLGAKRGLFRSFMALAAVLVALIGASLLTDALTGPVTEALMPRAEKSVQEWFDAAGRSPSGEAPELEGAEPQDEQPGESADTASPEPENADDASPLAVTGLLKNLLHFDLDGAVRRSLRSAARDAAEQVGVLSFNLDGREPEETADALAQRGFALRGGLHCAPYAHRTAGTLPNGTVRLSVSAFTSAADIDAFAHVLRSIVRG